MSGPGRGKGEEKMKKTAIVTGSSRGIGFAIARQLGLSPEDLAARLRRAQRKPEPK